MPRLYILLSREEFDELKRKANLARRHPRDQAAFIVARHLGFPDDPESQPEVEPEQAVA
jgi:hypothetical protein